MQIILYFCGENEKVVVVSSSILAKASIWATCLAMRSQSAEVPAPEDTNEQNKGDRDVGMVH